MSDIGHFVSVLPPELCIEMISIFEASNSKIPSHEYNGSQPNKERKGSIHILKDFGREGEIRSHIINTSREMIKVYSQNHSGLKVMADDNFLLTNPRIEKIDIGEGFDWHMDARQLQSDRRFLTVLFYLNNLTEGGETNFLYQGMKIYPAQGSLALFPPFWTHIHKGEKPVNEPKYTLGLFASL